MAPGPGSQGYSTVALITLVNYKNKCLGRCKCRGQGQCQLQGHKPIPMHALG